MRPSKYFAAAAEREQEFQKREARLLAELAAYKEGSEQAFGAVVEQKQAAEKRCGELQETIFTMQAIIAKQREQADALRTAALAGAEALQYLGGTLHAQRLRDAASGEAPPPTAKGLRVYREPELKGCAAGSDGDCVHSQCPQLRDREPMKSGRHCPLDA